MKKLRGFVYSFSCQGEVFFINLYTDKLALGEFAHLARRTRTHEGIQDGIPFVRPRKDVVTRQRLGEYRRMPVGGPVRGRFEITVRDVPDVRPVAEPPDPPVLRKPPFGDEGAVEKPPGPPDPLSEATVGAVPYGVECFRSSFGEDEHILEALVVAVGVRKTEPALSVDHRIVEIEPEFLEIQRLPEARPRLASLDGGVAHHPDDNPPVLKDPRQPCRHRLEVVERERGLSVVGSKVVVGRRGHHEIDAAVGNFFEEALAVALHEDRPLHGFTLRPKTPSIRPRSRSVPASSGWSRIPFSLNTWNTPSLAQYL